MTPSNGVNFLKNNRKYSSILLMLLPFHPPLIPPLGISCLKGFLQPHGYKVKTVDGNTEEELRTLYSKYFAVLEQHIPRDKQANFYNIGNELLRNHMMAANNYENEKEYEELVKTIIVKSFFCEPRDELVDELNKILENYYSSLKEYLQELLDKEKPEVLGLSAFKGTLPSSLFALELAKEKYPAVMTVIGGGVFADQLAYGSPELEFFAEKTPYIDKIIIGEGENLFLKLLQGELPHSQKVYTLKDIQPYFVDVSSVRTPDFSDYNVGYYPYLANYTSRSCPFQCTFCGETIFWGKYRKKEPGQIVDEIMELYGKYNQQLFLMCDSLLNPTIDKLSEELMKHLDHLPVYFDGYLRLDQPVCDIENTMRWRRGGYYRARLGAESGSQRILDMMDKKITTRQIKSAVACLAYAGIKTTTYWIAGYPGETEEDFQQTLDLIEEMKDDIYEAEANPFWYYLNALVKSDDWAKKCVLLYPEKAKEMLILQTRVLDIEPTPAERHRRLSRFAQHCKRLGIPNPYSLSDIYNADIRWKGLHENAVPPMNDFFIKKKIDKAREISPLLPRSLNKIPVSPLPGDDEAEVEKKETAEPSKILQIEIDTDLTAKLDEIGIKEDSTPFVTMLAIINTWIAVISNQPVITVGTLLPETINPEPGKNPGMMINPQHMLPQHLDLSGNPNCRQILAQTKQVISGARRQYDPLAPAAHRYPILFIGYESFNLNFNGLKTYFTPLPDIIEAIKEKIDENEDHFIDCGYTIQQDLLIEMLAGKEDHRGRLFIRYNRQRFRAETIKRYFDRFQSILEAFLNSTGLCLSQLRSRDTELEADELEELF